MTAPETGDRSAAPDRWAGRLPYLAALYYTIYFLGRLAFSPTLDFDQAEQALFAQDWALGYPKHLPLYTWLQALLFEIGGRSLITLTVLKPVLLCAAVVLIYATVRELGGARTTAAAAALGLFLLPQFGFQSLTVLTMTPLVTAATAFALWALARVFRRRRATDYAWLALAATLGLLSKYNFAIVFPAAVIAALFVPNYRPAILDRRFLFALAAAFAAVSAPYLWIVEHASLSMAHAGKLYAGAPAGWLDGVASGVAELGEAMLIGVGPLVLLYGIVAFRALGRGTTDDMMRWAALCFGLGLTLCLLLVFAAGVTAFQQHWLLPLGLPLAIALAGRAVPAMAPAGRRWFLRGGGAVAVLLLTAVAAVGVFGGRFGIVGPIHMPFRELAAEVRALGFEGGTIIADRNRVGGNLALQFPDARVLCPRCLALRGAIEGPVLLAWQGRRDPAMPADVRAFYEERVGPLPDDLEVHLVRQPFYYAPDFRYPLAVAIVPEAVVDR